MKAETQGREEKKLCYIISWFN